MPQNSLIVGVDLSPIKPIPRTITFQGDITTDKCRAQIRQHLKSMKADTVLHDGAPNVGTAWVQDAFSQAELVLESLRLATDFLKPGGNFITKIFRSKDYNSLLWVFNQLFEKVEATKPPSSRGVSAEIFVVCRDYKAPKHLDPRFVDPKAVFAELADPTPNNEAKVFNPEVKKRKRQGYEEGDYTQFKEVSVTEFIQTTDPIQILGGVNKLSLVQPPNGDVALAAIDKMPETTQEIRDCCADLKVLGRKDFKNLLRWRLKIREKFGFSTKKSKEAEAAAAEEVTEVEPMDEEMAMQEELQKQKDANDSRKKKDRRRENERKQKEIVRMQMNMTTPFDIGLDQVGANAEESMFDLRPVDRAGAAGKIASGKMHTIQQKPEPESDQDEEDESDSDGDDLEGQLDSMYAHYQERRKEVDAKYRAKKARKEHEDFEGFSDREENSGSDDEVIEQDDASDESDDDEEEGPLSQTIAAEDEKKAGLSRRAANFFDQDLFRELGALDAAPHDDSGIDMDDSDEAQRSAQAGSSSKRGLKEKASIEEAEEEDDSDAEDSEASFEIVKAPKETHDDENWDPETQAPALLPDGRPNVDIITAEAMTLAHQLAQGGAAGKAALLDDAFNRYSFRDTDGLPEWFLDDESTHSRLQKPISAAAAAAIKEKMRALNARPIKKVREAKARKKFKAAQRLEKLKRKSALLADEDGDMTERDKAQAIEKIMARASKKTPRRETKVVVARGPNRGISGRPKGTKGRYKMVDARMKKDLRGLKRAAKKGKR